MTPKIKQRIEQIRRGEVPEGYKRTKAGIMPIDWCREKEYKAKDVFKSVTNKKHNGEFEALSATQDKGVIPRSQVDIDIKFDESNLTGYKKVDRGDFVISLRSFQGGIEYSEYEGLVSPAYTVLKPIVPIYDGYYKAYLKTSDYINRLNKGTYGIRDGKQIGFEDFGDMILHFPPLAEQQKIAEILSAQDRLIALKEKLIEEKKRQKKYLMQQLLTGKKRLPGFSGEWGKKSIGELCEILDSFRKPLNATERSGRAKIYPYYGANGIVDYVDEYLIDGSMILLAEDGGNFEDYCQKPIAYWVSGKCWVNNHAHILKPKSDFCNKFIFYSLQHKDIRLFINGTTRSKLTQEDLVSITITLPMDIEEQKRIAAIICVTDSEIDLLQKELDQEKQKKKALMQLLLTGIVRIGV